jgi:hypothetical protein
MDVMQVTLEPLLCNTRTVTLATGAAYAEPTAEDMWTDWLTWMDTYLQFHTL